jgi:hypothetical protein
LSLKFCNASSERELPFGDREAKLNTKLIENKTQNISMPLPPIDKGKTNPHASTKWNTIHIPQTQNGHSHNLEFPTKSILP